MAKKPNLAMIPSGYKDQVLYSVIPNTTIGDFDVSRATEATKINKDGLIEIVTDDNAPRLNYDLTNGVPSECPHLLLEGSSTNICLWSESIANWNTVNATVVANDATAPDGKVDADIITITASGGGVNSSLSTVTASTEYTFSYYVKLGTISSTETKLAIYNNSGLTWIDSDVSYTASTTYWTRVERTFTTPVGCTSITFYPQRDSSGGIGTLWVWGCQIETGGFASSYIPNNAMTGSTTRNAEACNGAGNVSTFNSEQGILYCEIASLTGAASIGDRRIVLANSGDTNNVIRIHYNNIANAIQYKVRVASTNTCNITHDLGDSTEYHKICGKWKQNDFALWVDGVEVATDTSGAVFSADTLNTLNFANASGISDFFYGKVKDLRVYDTQGMTDTEITDLLTQITA